MGRKMQCKHCEFNLYRGLTEDYSQGNSFSVALRNCSEEARGGVRLYGNFATFLKWEMKMKN